MYYLRYWRCKNGWTLWLVPICLRVYRLPGGWFFDGRVTLQHKPYVSDSSGYHSRREEDKYATNNYKIIIVILLYLVFNILDDKIIENLSQHPRDNPTIRLKRRSRCHFMVVNKKYITWKKWANLSIIQKKALIFLVI